MFGNLNWGLVQRTVRSLHIMRFVFTETVTMSLIQREMAAHTSADREAADMLVQP